MPAGNVDRTVLASFYQNPGETYDDAKTEGALNVLADKIDANADIFKTGGSALIVSDTIPGVTGVNVHAQLSDLGSKIQSLQDGVVPGGTITNAMLSGGITEDKLDFAIATQAELDAVLATKGQVNGIASLGSDGKVPAAQLPPGTWEKLSDSTLAADQAANTMLTFTGLSVYRVINIVFSARSTNTVDALNVRFNNDSATKNAYRFVENATTGTTVNQAQILLQNSLGTVANAHVQGVIEILNESNKVKVLQSRYSMASGASAASAPTVSQVHGVYFDTASPISSVSIFTLTQSIQAGSRFTVYGLK